MPKYNVYIFAIVKVKVSIEAADLTEAAAEAEKRFNKAEPDFTCNFGEASYADEIQDFMVEHVDDQGNVMEFSYLECDDLP